MHFKLYGMGKKNDTWSDTGTGLDFGETSAWFWLAVARPAREVDLSPRLSVIPCKFKSRNPLAGCLPPGCRGHGALPPRPAAPPRGGGRPRRPPEGEQLPRRVPGGGQALQRRAAGREAALRAPLPLPGQEVPRRQESSGEAGHM